MDFDIWRGELLTRCERNAMSQLDPNIQSIAETVIMDPLDHPRDRNIWTTMFLEARKVHRNLYADLFFIRGVGTKLRPNEAYGLRAEGWPYEFIPMVSAQSWPSRQVFYEIMQHLLGRYDMSVVYQIMVRTWEGIR